MYGSSVFSFYRQKHVSGEVLVDHRKKKKNFLTQTMAVSAFSSRFENACSSSPPPVVIVCLSVCSCAREINGQFPPLLPPPPVVNKVTFSNTGDANEFTLPQFSHTAFTFLTEVA